MGYQIGTENGNVAYCELLNTDAFGAYDQSGTMGDESYCGSFWIYDKGCGWVYGDP